MISKLTNFESDEILVVINSCKFNKHVFYKKNHYIFYVTRIYPNIWNKSDIMFNKWLNGKT